MKILREREREERYRTQKLFEERLALYRGKESRPARGRAYAQKGYKPN